LKLSSPRPPTEGGGGTQTILEGGRVGRKNVQKHSSPKQRFEVENPLVFKGGGGVKRGG